MSLFRSLAALLLLSRIFTVTAAAQQPGDYRSNGLLGSVSLNNPLNWEKYTLLLGTYQWVALSGLSTAPSGDFRDGQTITIRANDTWSNSSAITVPAGVKIVHQGHNGTFSSSNRITINGAYEHATSASPQTVSNGMTLGSNSSVWFTYAGNQVIPGRADYDELVVTGGGTKTLGTSTFVLGHVTLLNTMLDIGNYDLSVWGEVIRTGAVYIKTSGTGELILKNVGAAARTFPVGRSTYNPVVISDGGGMDYGVLVTDGVYNAESPVESDKSVQRTWFITPAGTPSGASITLQYEDAGQVGADFKTGDPVRVFNYHNGAWAGRGSAGMPAGTPGGTRSVTITEQSEFSPFAVANVSGVLPVRFTAVRAQRGSEGAQLEFTNATEAQVTSYAVERSSDGIRFATVATVAPRVNNGASASYRYADRTAPAGRLWYRIAAREWSGRSVLSAVLPVGAEQPRGLSLQPNPLRGERLLFGAASLPAGAYTFRIYTASGLELRRVARVHTGGSLQQELRTGALPAGLYYVAFSGPVSATMPLVAQ
ncbi:hypothetical protein [Flaviaesturariibacter amylovorans]|uniref:T9SS type A sorting domain-containing protein n=1 Tax=Flaviaesturariibacter amylovorans TaxID=1084520 RepID=A0ABP8GMN8_9BACT